MKDKITLPKRGRMNSFSCPDIFGEELLILDDGTLLYQMIQLLGKPSFLQLLRQGR